MVSINNRKFVFLYLILFFTLYGVYSYIVLNYKYMYMNIEYPMWDNVKSVISNNKNNYNVLYIGDSRAKAGFIPNLFNKEHIKSVNLAVGGGTPIEGYYTLKEYLKNNITPKYIILSYSPFHLAKQDVFWHRTVRFNFLDIKKLNEIINASSEIEVSNATLGSKDKVLDYYIYTGKYMSEFVIGILEKRWGQYFDTINNLEKSNGHHYFGKLNLSNGLNAEVKMAKFTPSILLSLYLDKLLELGKKNNIKIYYYTMPFNKSSFDKMNSSFKNNYNKYIKLLGDRYNMTVLNKLYYLENENFGDSSHLFYGAEKVTLEIKNRFFSKQ